MTLKKQVKTIVKDSNKKRKEEKRERQKRKKENELFWTKKLKEERKEEKRKKQKELIRTDEEWKKIDSYLENLLKESAKDTLIEIGLSKYIRIDCNYLPGMHTYRNAENKRIYLNDNTGLEITHEDIQKFCEQHKFKLRYNIKKLIFWDIFESEFPWKYPGEDILKAYLIKV